uniref:Ubiquitin specific peptidase 40 n=1 Tax=Varanus komodoensis TaxID=61221 RepID=A0A8D2KY21_VARKO
MFGDLFNEDFFLSSNQYGKPKLKLKDAEPPVPRGNTNLSGIKNQGGTCYLNSLLQTLLFTPEFRGMVRIIPLQLQRLFAQLLLLDQQAASTADLTDSFGWKSNEEMRQHDVQELNRILFSALETSLVGTSGHNLINQLYRGTVVNQVVCKECKNVSERQEDFLDLTVAVKGVSGLEEALWNMFVEEEHFEGENLYRCGTCDKLVEARKSAKLRKLPPFLTVSLLRFNFDYEKCERYKETSHYTFPIRINLQPFCEQTQLDDLEYMYELFSVIIHKGGCYGGHYHVYIRDIDELGNWKVLSPWAAICLSHFWIMILLFPLELAVDQLAQKFLEKRGVSWNKRYRKQYGPIRKYLQNHSQAFLLSSDESKVQLNNQSHEYNFGSISGSHIQKDNVTISLEQVSTGLEEYSSESHWFDLNDSKVQPTKERDIEKQFQGNESAYMLFYRQSQMTRPSEARGNPRYRVPNHLLNEMDATNIKLQKKRAEYDLAKNTINLHLHIHSHYTFCNGALHPLVSQKENILYLSIDKRKTLRNLRQSAFQMLEFWEGDLVLSLAKSLPAGLHIYQVLEGEESTLSSIGLFDGADIFVWNGKEVDGAEVLVGIDHEPVLINVLRLAGHNEGQKGQQFMESQHVFPCSSSLGMVREALTSPEGIILKNHSGSNKEAENWEVIPEEDLKKTLKNVGLSNGSSILVLDSHDQRLVLQLALLWLQVKNFCSLETEEMQVKITATIETVSKGTVILHGCDGLPEDYTVKEAELKMGSLLGLCLGKAPTATQLFLHFVVGPDLQASPEMEIVVEETTTVKEVNTGAVKFWDNWHLRKMDWCYEAGEALNEEDATLKELNICSGETLNVAEGKLPPKVNNNFCVKAVPLDLLAKHFPFQVMTLPSFQEFSIPAPEFLRVWTMENKRPSKLLRNNKEQLYKFKLGSRVEICVEPLHKEDNLGLKDMLLRVMMHIPGKRDYYHPVDLVWDISKACTASALRQRIAEYFSLPLEKIEIAKYSPGKFEWMPICSWTQQISRKKKKKSDSLQLSPYSLRDGDIIGVQNLLLDDSKDFSTIKDDIGKQMQKQFAVEKTR